jgi:predicted TIM-barrel fold metal-dependent hydrolase
MERISVLSKGRVHTFAPFDPFREIAYQARIRGASWSALDAVKQWVALHGCIGVKIYPPMGFAPYGNAAINLDSWRRRWDWLPNVERISDGKGSYATLGQRLDDVLGELYSWCVENDLPVMAHTSLSNGLRGFDDFPAAVHWATLRDSFGHLRINFGHMGGLEGTQEADWSMAPNEPPPHVNARDLLALCRQIRLRRKSILCRFSVYGKYSRGSRQTPEGV